MGFPAGFSGLSGHPVSTVGRVCGIPGVPSRASVLCVSDIWSCGLACMSGCPDGVGRCLFGCRGCPGALGGCVLRELRFSLCTGRLCVRMPGLPGRLGRLCAPGTAVLWAHGSVAIALLPGSLIPRKSADGSMLRCQRMCGEPVLGISKCGRELDYMIARPTRRMRCPGICGFPSWHHLVTCAVAWVPGCMGLSRNARCPESPGPVEAPGGWNRSNIRLAGFPGAPGRPE